MFEANAGLETGVLVIPLLAFLVTESVLVAVFCMILVALSERL